MYVSPQSGQQSILAKRQAAGLRIHRNGVARGELASEDIPGQRIFQLLLNCALEWPRTIDRIEAEVAEQVECLVREVEFQLTLGQPLGEVFDLDARNRADLLFVERAEH